MRDESSSNSESSRDESTGQVLCYEGRKSEDARLLGELLCMYVSNRSCTSFSPAPGDIINT